jgi:hypothetical protein
VPTINNTADSGLLYVKKNLPFSDINSSNTIFPSPIVRRPVPETYPSPGQLFSRLYHGVALAVLLSPLPDFAISPRPLFRVPANMSRASYKKKKKRKKKKTTILIVAPSREPLNSLYPYQKPLYNTFSS